MSAVASQITSLTIVNSSVYSMRRSIETSKLCVTGLCEGNSPMTGEFPAQRASNAEKVSIWWRYHKERMQHMYILYIPIIFSKFNLVWTADTAIYNYLIPPFSSCLHHRWCTSGSIVEGRPSGVLFFTATDADGTTSWNLKHIMNKLVVRQHIASIHKYHYFFVIYYSPGIIPSCCDSE